MRFLPLLLLLPLGFLACAGGKCYYGKLELSPVNEEDLASGKALYEGFTVEISGTEAPVSVDAQTGTFSVCGVKQTFKETIRVFHNGKRMTSSKHFGWSDDPESPWGVIVQTGVRPEGIDAPDSTAQTDPVTIVRP
jgi:hypothetical protein